MPNNLTVVISGKKTAGKSSLGKYILAQYLNARAGHERFTIEMDGKDVLLVDTLNSNTIVAVDYPNKVASDIYNAYSAKIYSFADPLKKICIDVLGLDSGQCYGTDDDKNSQTHILWDDLPASIREKYSRNRRGGGGTKPASGFMTGREVMQVLGTDYFRQIDPSCWARGLYSTIEQEGYSLAIVTDARFPNEITIGTERDAFAIRLTRKLGNDIHESEKALDDFPLGEFSLVVDNEGLEMAETHKKVKPHIDRLFQQRRLI